MNGSIGIRLAAIGFVLLLAALSIVWLWLLWRP
jgi:hypothetical protein